mmetsp:Transcript_12123/g.19800  ORF Transcript_12123/g.19800 Transcript_12123/m.19800 type:complete len:290 (-) Transcript_12123:84-953(-)|eukprot:jgi/Bigna1/74874/fgenesh1_pg.31_\
MRSCSARSCFPTGLAVVIICMGQLLHPRGQQNPTIIASSNDVTPESKGGNPEHTASNAANTNLAPQIKPLFMKKGEWHYYATFHKKPLGILFAQWKHRAAVQSAQNLTGIEFGDVVKSVNEQRCEKEGFFNITRKIIDAKCPITILFRRPETRLTRFLNCVKKISDKTVEKKLAEAKNLLKKFEREDAERDNLVPSIDKEAPCRKISREDSDLASKRKDDRMMDNARNSKNSQFSRNRGKRPMAAAGDQRTQKRERGRRTFDRSRTRQSSRARRNRRRDASERSSRHKR